MAPTPDVLILGNAETGQSVRSHEIIAGKRTDMDPEIRPVPVRKRTVQRRPISSSRSRGR